MALEGRVTGVLLSVAIFLLFGIVLTVASRRIKSLRQIADDTSIFVMGCECVRSGK